MGRADGGHLLPAGKGHCGQPWWFLVAFLPGEHLGSSESLQEQKMEGSGGIGGKGPQKLAEALVGVVKG